MNWYYDEEGMSRGPVKEEDFALMVQRKDVPADALAWHPGLEEWQPIRELQPEWLAAASAPGQTKQEDNSPEPKPEEDSGQEQTPSSPAAEDQPAATEERKDEPEGKESVPAPGAQPGRTPASEREKAPLKAIVSKREQQAAAPAEPEGKGLFGRLFGKKKR